MDDQIIDAATARKLHTEGRQNYTLVGWIVMRDPLAYPGKFSARLVTGTPTPVSAAGRPAD
jgi:hypothetical protein